MNRDHIRVILNDPRAKKLIALNRKHVLTGLQKEIGDRMIDLGVRSIDNIAQTVEADLRTEDGEGNVTVPVGSAAKKHQDMVSFELLKRIGYGGSPEGEDKERRPLMSKDTEKRLVEGIERATQAQITYDQAEEAEFEVVDVGE